MFQIVEGFASAPIKLAAMISVARTQKEPENRRAAIESPTSSRERAENRTKINNLTPTTSKYRKNDRSSEVSWSNSSMKSNTKLWSNLFLSLMVTQLILSSGLADSNDPNYFDHKVPLTHFSYLEGRQSRSASDKLMESLELMNQPQVGQNEENMEESAHIYKRSSALLVAPPAVQHSPLVSSMQLPMARVNLHLSRRIMMSPLGRSNEDLASLEQTDPMVSQASNQMGSPSISGARSQRTNNIGSGISQEETDLLRQKQHIQYHDQWPSLAGKCHKRTLNFCASVLPFNTTTFPNIIGDTNRFEVKRSLPFFGFLAKSSCNKRLDELLCLLLEPPCSIQSGLAIPPCKKFCRLALEGCNEYIPATLALSSVFDCRQYPDSNDPNVCVNLAQGNRCGQDEFKCPDQTCIPSQ